MISDNQPLDTLFWRDEILQVMFWLRGEGLAQTVTAQELEVFLNNNASTLHFYLEQFTEEGYLTRHPDPAGMPGATRYELNDLGRREGGRRFQDEFAGMQKSGHGECSADCSCHQTGDHANCPSHHHH
ncbi:MAG: hypothetical protein FOGNACKC_01300 [Anaerolineae bacterium]|nr:hypothetical protein [Anaerolineae bacterium]